MGLLENPHCDEQEFHQPPPPPAQEMQEFFNPLIHKNCNKFWFYYYTRRIKGFVSTKKQILLHVLTKHT